MARLPLSPADEHVYTVPGKPPRYVRMLLHATIGYTELTIKGDWIKQGPRLTVPRSTWDKEMMFATEEHIADLRERIGQAA